MDYANELTQIEDKVNKQKEQKITLFERSRLLKEEKMKFIEELKKLNISPGTLEEEIEALEVALQQNIQEIKKIIK